MTSNQLIVQTQCKNTPVNLLIDTGASISFVNSIFVRVNNLSQQVRPTKTMISGLGKKIIPVQGEITLPVLLGNCEVDHVFIVCDKLDNEFLIGIDVLKKIGATIDLPRNKLRTRRREIDFITKPVKIKDRLRIKCHKNITLPANTTGYIWGKIPVKDSKENYEGVVDPFKKLTSSKGIFITGSISYSKKNLIPIHYVNVMPDDVTIYRNQLMGFLEPLENDKCVKGVYRTDHYDASIDLPRLDDAESVETTMKKGKWENPQDLHSRLGIEDMKIPTDYKNRLKNLITEYSHCFARDRFDLGRASFYKARINLKRDSQAKWVPSRNVPYKLEPHMDNEIENMARAGHIIDCPYSLWNSSCFLVSKPQANSQADSQAKSQAGLKFRFVQDGRSINSQSIQDCYELPKINKILDKMSNCKWLSNLYFQASFNQIELKESSQPITAFTHKGKRYQWNRMVMGTKSASAEWSRAINQLFSKLPFETLVLYIDDMLLWSHDLESHLNKLRFVFERLTWGNLKLNCAKTRLLQTEVTWLGRKVSADGVRLDEEKVKAIRALPPPTSVKRVQKFLGALNYNRQFIKGFANIAAPLYNLLKKGVKFA